MGGIPVSLMTFWSSSVYTHNWTTFSSSVFSELHTYRLEACSCDYKVMRTTCTVLKNKPPSISLWRNSLSSSMKKRGEILSEMCWFFVLYFVPESYEGILKDRSHWAPAFAFASATNWEPLTSSKETIEDAKAEMLSMNVWSRENYMYCQTFSFKRNANNRHIPYACLIRFGCSKCVKYIHNNWYKKGQWHCLDGSRLITEVK